jgi:uncharacterized protein
MHKSVRIGRSSAGLGLFAVSDIKKGEFIIEYVGHKLTNKEANENTGKYLFEVNSRLTIDGSPRWNTARYINHSCRPNCEIEIERGHINVYARLRIKSGEELNYDYGKDYFDEFIKSKGCRCEKCDIKMG